MKLNKILFGLLFTASVTNALAAKAPVVDVIASAGSPRSLIERVASLERKLEARNKAQVEVQRQLDESQTEKNFLRGVTELHSHQISQLLNRQRELYQELDRRVSEALKQAEPKAVYALAPDVTATNPDVVSLNVAQDYSHNVTENEAYDRALNLVLKDKRYEQAILEFRVFNKSYPQSSYAPNSHYWLGQLLYNKAKLTEAQQEFDIVVKQHPDSAKRPDALLKLAMVAQKLNNQKDALLLYRQLLKEYPDSTSAQLAKPRLLNLQK